MPSKLPSSPLSIGTRSNDVGVALAHQQHGVVGVKPLSVAVNGLIGAARHRAAAGRDRDAIRRRRLDARATRTSPTRPWRR